jgi:hypothetical protein
MTSFCCGLLQFYRFIFAHVGGDCVDLGGLAQSSGVYSTLTRMPGKHRLGGEQAMLLIGSERERLTVVALDGYEYANALEVSAALGIVGGSIYSAMLAHCATKAKAQTIYSWNGRRYALCGVEVTRRLRTP